MSSRIPSASVYVEIGSVHVRRFRTFRDRHLANTTVPSPGNWQQRSDNDLYLNVIQQVAVVGGSSGGQRLKTDAKLQASLSWKVLTALSPKQRSLRIHEALRAASVRYAARDLQACRKTAALAHNFNVLRNSGGPRAFLAQLAALEGPDASTRRVRHLMKALAFLKSKSARDFLMELGLVQDAIAFDVRVRNVLEENGIELPKGFESRPRQYDLVEQQVLERLCKPLNLAGVQFDRLLFQHYSKLRAWRS